MTDLSDFGGGIEPHDPPRIERKRVRWTPEVSNVDGKIAGFIGVVENRGDRPHKCYTTRRTGQHIYARKDAWAISQRILNVCENLGVDYVFVWDAGTKDVWEYAAAQFIDGREVPESDLEVVADPQRYVPLDDAAHYWKNHAEEMFARDFERAMDYCLN